MARIVDVSATVNGRELDRRVPARMTAADFIRDELGLTGTHVGCDHGVCGACTILLDGVAVRSCILFAPQLAGREVLTVEGLEEDGELHPLQRCFQDSHALQCGFCTPGFLLTAVELLGVNPAPDEHTIREAIGGNICRCTSYMEIVDAIQCAAAKTADRG
jgi:aerobic-type carbon monoxide dehydrogenase small subunit (CoxS/CutS family)